jgi:CubicO group peptidase (beta-lactamase class C family)
VGSGIHCATGQVGLPGYNGYGYFWWRRKTNGHQAYIASGAGGQLIAVIPDLEMVLVANCFLNEENSGREESDDSIYLLIRSQEYNYACVLPDGCRRLRFFPE